MVADMQDTFVFQGRTVLTAYAKYLIEYLKEKVMEVKVTFSSSAFMMDSEQAMKLLDIMKDAKPMSYAWDRSRYVYDRPTHSNSSAVAIGSLSSTHMAMLALEDAVA